MIRSYAVHGKAGDDKYNNIRLGLNSRLDTIQAAILQVKFKAFQEYEIKDVNKVANIYNKALKEADLDKILILPTIKEGFLSSWAQYTNQLPSGIDRSKVQNEMKAKNIPTMVYYMKPMHLQGAFEKTDSAIADCPITEEICETVLSLPMHPYMTEEQVEEVVKALKEVIKREG